MGRDILDTAGHRRILRWAEPLFVRSVSGSKRSGLTYLARSTQKAEITRLEDLATRNPQVSPSEIQALKQTRDETLAALVSPRVRLDALRLIWRV
jgi:hypothetical protein